MAKKDEPVVDLTAWRKLRANLRQKFSVQVGVLGAAGAARHPNSDLTLVELAAIHEFGAPRAGIPERSFIRSTFESGNVQTKMQALAGGLARRVAAGTLSWRNAFEQLGAWAASQVKTTIAQQYTLSHTGEDQALKPETIRRKGSTVPLVDTGRLIDAITHLVVEK